MKCTLKASWVTVFAVILVMSVVAGPLSAHHGRGATYANEELVWDATVTEVAWRNPHISFWADVRNEDGNVVNWAFEGPNVSTMTRQGWSRNTLKVGQDIMVRFHRAQSSAPVGLFRGIMLANGEEIFTQGGGASAIE